jgi:alkaline phosphatase D
MKTRFACGCCLLAALVLLTGDVSGQGKKKKKKIPGQYKRVHQNALSDILNGKPDKAIQSLERLLQVLPNDAESRYMLAVAYTKLGRSEDAVAQVKKAIAVGLPTERFVAGTITGLEPLGDHEALKKIETSFATRPVHGPMLGDVRGTSVKVWVRTAVASKVQVIASVAKGLSDPIRSPVVETSKQTDFTAEIPLTGLKPLTTYHYRVLVNGHNDGRPDGVLRTFHEQGKPTKFRLAFGGGAGFVPQHERAWTTIQQQKPDALLLLGDNTYIDDPKTPEMQHYCYYRRQSRPEFRKLVASVPVFSIWDDHDFGTNDCSGGPALNIPAWKQPVYRVFRNNWVNPYYGGGDAQPGCNYDFYLGDVHFVMLDGRYYRNLKPVDNGRSTMLGPKQRAWLKETIRKSKGKLLVLCSPVPWVFAAKGNSRDTWNGFREERNEIFDFLADNNVEGVILMSADRHRSDLWKIDRPKGYPLYEFNSSRLTNQHVHPAMKQAIFSYNKKQSFGVVDIDTTLADPTIKYTVVTIDGDAVHSHTLKRSQLTEK